MDGCPGGEGHQGTSIRSALVLSYMGRLSLEWPNTIHAIAWDLSISLRPGRRLPGFYTERWRAVPRRPTFNYRWRLFCLL